MLKVRFLSPAEKELDEAYAYYELQAKGLGTQFIDEVLRAIQNIKAYPEAWPKFSNHTRRCITSKFPYAVIYQLRDKDILIVAIAHLHRKPEYWQDRL